MYNEDYNEGIWHTKYFYLTAPPVIGVYNYTVKCYGAPISRELYCGSSDDSMSCSINVISANLTPTTTFSTIPTTTTYIYSTTTETTKPTTTTTDICFRKTYPYCNPPDCEWVGSIRLGTCKSKQISTYISTTLQTTTTGIIQTTNIPITTTTTDNCFGKNYFGCSLSGNCEWTGNLILGYCRSKGRTTTTTQTTTLIQTTNIIPETTTTTIVDNCIGKNYSRCIIDNNCRWTGSLLIGYCSKK
jgi:hypothetical protein